MLEKASQKDQVEEWRSHPMTQRYRKYLLSRRLSLMEAWAQGNLSEDSEFRDSVMMAAALRECQVLWELYSLDEESLFEVEE